LDLFEKIFFEICPSPKDSFDYKGITKSVKCRLYQSIEERLLNMQILDRFLFYVILFFTLLVNGAL